MVVKVEDKGLKKSSEIAPSPMEVMISAMNAGSETGMTCEIKRKLPDGSIVDAGPKALGAENQESSSVCYAEFETEAARGEAHMGSRHEGLRKRAVCQQ